MITKLKILAQFMHIKSLNVMPNMWPPNPRQENNTIKQSTE